MRLRGELTLQGGIRRQHHDRLRVTHELILLWLVRHTRILRLLASLEIVLRVRENTAGWHLGSGGLIFARTLPIEGRVRVPQAACCFLNSQPGDGLVYYLCLATRRRFVLLNNIVYELINHVLNVASNGLFCLLESPVLQAGRVRFTLGPS